MSWGAQEHAGFDSLKSTLESEEKFVPSNKRLTFKDKRKDKVTIKKYATILYVSKGPSEQPVEAKQAVSVSNNWQ